MALSATLLDSNWDTVAGSKTTPGATPALGDYIIVVVAATSGSAGTNYATGLDITDDNSDNLGGTGSYYQIQQAESSGYAISIYARKRKIQSATSTKFTAPISASSTGGGLAVLNISGVYHESIMAIRQNAKEEGSGAIPSPTFANVPLSTSAIIGAITKSATTGTSPRTGYTEVLDSTYSSPSTALEIMVRNSGETSATIAWGATVSATYCAEVIEIVSIPTSFISFRKSLFDTNAGTHSVTLAASVIRIMPTELFLVAVMNTGVTATPTVSDDAGDGGTYTLISSTAWGSTSQHSMFLFVRSAFLSMLGGTTISATGASSTGGGLAVFSVGGIYAKGASVVRQYQTQTGTASTPTVNFNYIPQLQNSIFAFICQDSASAMTPPTGFTERVDTTYATPNAGIEIATLDSAQSALAVTWGSATGGNYGAITAEIGNVSENFFNLFI